MKLILSFLLVGLTNLLFFACSGTSSPNDGKQNTFNASGSFFYMTYGAINRFQQGGLPQKIFDVGPQNKEWLGWGGSVITDLDEASFSNGYEIHIRQWTGERVENIRDVSLAGNSSYFIRGPVQPSPSGKKMMISVSAASANSNERILGFHILDEGNNLITSRAPAVDPSWLSENVLVAGNGSDLNRYILDTNTVVRIGPPGLGAPNAMVRQISISPSLQKIAFIQNDSVWVINSDGQNLMQLSLPYPGVNWPTWSPDGTQIAVVSSACNVSGTGAPTPEIAVLDTSRTQQDIRTAPRWVRSDGVPFRACGPIYWK